MAGQETSGKFFKTLVAFNALILLWLAGISFYLFTTRQTPAQTQNTQKPAQKVTTTTSPTSAINSRISLTTQPSLPVSPTPTPFAITPAPVAVQYVLPQGWNATVNGNGIMITATGGGYFYIKAYTYNGSSPKDHYCKITQYCTAATKFTDQQIGNIAGFRVSGLDNGGGGSDYVGSKDDKMYIINSYYPGGTSQFYNEAPRVLSSLIF